MVPQVEEVELASTADLFAVIPKKKRGRPRADIHRGIHRCFRLDCKMCAAEDRRAEDRRDARTKQAGCRCGQRGCDCATWDRIYREKFEDPEYYTRGTNLRSETPLRSLQLMDRELSPSEK